MNLINHLSLRGLCAGFAATLLGAGPSGANQAPVLRITAPTEGASYAVGTTVPFRVEARDPDGYATYAAFFVDGRKVWEQTINFLVAPPPGLTQVFESQLITAGFGSRKFAVQVTDDQGGKAELGLKFTVGPVVDPPESQRIALIKAGSEWRYHALNQDLGTSWLAADFSDQGWSVGPAQLGFGDGDETTKIPATEPRQPTVYFRRTFDVPADLGIAGLVVRLLRDDGARIWLNGQPLVTDNLPDGEIKFGTLANNSAGEPENGWHEFRVPAPRLVVGRNQLAVEVHQVSLTSSDLSFDLELLALVQATQPNLPHVSIEATAPGTGEACPTCRFAPGVFTIRRTGDTAAELPVWLLYSGTATRGGDYAELPPRVNIPKGADQVVLYVAGAQDELVEGPETVIASLDYGPTDGPQTYEIDPARGRAQVTIQDSTISRVPELRIVATRKETREPFLCLAPPCPLLPDVAPAVWTLSRTGGDLSSPLQVALGFSGTAANGVDYEKLPGSATIPAGAASVEILVTALADAIAEDDETVVAQILIPPGLPDVPPPYWVVNGEASVVIHNLGGRFTPQVSLVATQPVTSEGCPTCLVAPGILRLSRTGPTDAALYVLLSYSGTATPGVDYDKLPEYVEIPAGQAFRDLMVLPRYDPLVEGAETVVALIEPDPTDGIFPQYAVNTDSATAKVTIHDAPDTSGVPVVSVTASRPGIAECPAQLACKIPPVDLVFRRTGGRLDGPLTFFVNWSGAAIWGEDYRVTDDESPRATLTFPEGSDQVTLQLAAFTDCLIEDTEVASVEILPDLTLGPLEHYRVDPLASSAKVEIYDGSQPSEGIASVWMEANGQAWERCPDSADCIGILFVLRRSGGQLKNALEVPWSFSGTATPGLDFEKPARSVTFKPGEDTARVYLAPIDDQLVEGDETVGATLLCSDAADSGFRIIGKAASATVVIHDNKATGGLAVVEMLEPKNGTTFTSPESIPFRARTVDPSGAMTSLQLYAGDQLIGESNITFVRAPDPGTPIEHSFVWKNPPLGEHKIYAVGPNSRGQKVFSPAVLIRVVRADGRPVVTVMSGVAETREVPLGSKMAVIPGTFVLKRSGSTDQPLRIDYTVAGTAKNGRDYGLLDGDASFAAGQSEREIQVVPLSDALVEGDETVELTLSPRNVYSIGAPGAARVVIHDAPVLNGGSVAWLEPQDGSRWVAGKDLNLRVTVQDPTGYAVAVDFYADGKLLGTTPLIICLGLNCEPKPGTSLEFSFLWKSVPCGTHTLTAVARTTAGKPLESAPVQLNVVPAEPESFVIRHLPASYEPGTPLKVSLKAAPDTTSGSYALQDSPPKGWVVANISDGGSWDAAHGAVKFGPFLDGQARSLSYEATPGTGFVGEARFAGLASQNGRESKIGGDQVIHGTWQVHPADSGPRDWSVGLNEVTAYGAAWKSGAKWLMGPNPIPLDFVTRAGALWRSGEGYRYEPSAGEAPLCWVNEHTVGKPMAAPSVDLSPADFTAALQRLRETQSFVAAQLVAANSGSQLRVSTAPGVAVGVHALEVEMPSGVMATSISDEGVFDPARGVIRWGPFFDGTPRQLTAVLGGAPTAGCTAILSADGSSIKVSVLPMDGVFRPAPRIAEVRRLPDGSVQLFVVDVPQQGCALEFSDDLITWRRFASARPGAGCDVHHDDDADESQHRYYRSSPRP